MKNKMEVKKTLT